MTREGLWGHGLGNLEIMKLIIFGLGNILVSMFISHTSVYILLCIAHPICVCGDDRISCYPGANDVTGGPGDA